MTGIGNGLFWPAQSTLITVLTPRERRHAAFAMQRVVMNLGIGLGALVGGLIATTSRPATFDVLFLVNGATFVVYLAVLMLLVPEPSTAASRRSAAGGSYAPVVRDRPFMGVVALNTLFIFAGMAGFELLPVYAKNEAAVTETMIGVDLLREHGRDRPRAACPSRSSRRAIAGCARLRCSVCSGRAAGCSCRSPGAGSRELRQPSYWR